jgi:pyruvate/2-oxoglutarate dehydrogenase complex dihydrolipoamide dehydrogenase (E3) component
MTVDYDLIIVGGASVGRYAAAQANRLGARVALIEHSQSEPSLLPALLIQLNHALRQQSWLQQWAQPIRTALNWSQMRQSADTLTDTLAASIAVPYSLAQLAAQGVEVIRAEGAFCRHPQLGFSVTNRLLRGRTYLLAPAVEATVPAIGGLSTSLLTSLNSGLPSGQTLPRQLLILGSDPRGIELAQVLNRLGTQVTLIVSGERLLPHEDPDVAFLMQAILEAEGVTVLTSTQISQVRQLNDQIWVQAGNRAIVTEDILLATKPQLNLASLNLEAASVKWQPHRILVNRKLQTTHPRIYACGESLGGYVSTALDRHEADIALHNAFFFPRKQVDYGRVPWLLFTDPPLVRIGLTEPQARQLYGKDVLVAQQSMKSLQKAQLCDDTTGFLKLITRRNGKILGAHGIAPQASEWIGIIALAMQQRLNLKALAQLPMPSPTFAELIQRTADQLQQERRSEWQRELLETWFNFRRAR